MDSDRRHAGPGSTTKDSFSSDSHSHQYGPGVEISVGVKVHDSYTQSVKIHGRNSEFMMAESSVLPVNALTYCSKVALVFICQTASETAILFLGWT